MEPISTALTHVQGEQANKLAQAVFKMVGVTLCSVCIQRIARFTQKEFC